MDKKMLALFTPIKTPVYSDGKISLSKQFTKGIIEYLKYWDGSIRLFIESAPSESHNFDNAHIHPKDLPFEVEVISYHSDQLHEHLKKADVALLYLDKSQIHIQKLCDQVNTPTVYVSEYTLRTRRGIIRSHIHNPIRRLWREAKEIYFESLLIPSVKKAIGIQCSGFSTYKAYKNTNQNPFLFLDGRVHSDDLIQHDAYKKKLEKLQRKGPLNLFFSGRLDPMKGAGDLTKIAYALLKRNCNFTMYICGSGPLEEKIRTEITELGLGHHVHMKGVLDFKKGLLPFKKEHIDLFICTHVQGDPSCTYMETLACGVPILGYENEAFSGILEHAPVGWKTAIGNIEEMATTIIRLDQQRQEIEECSRHGLIMAAQHTFEKTFESRISHVKNCIEEYKKKEVLK